VHAPAPQNASLGRPILAIPLVILAACTLLGWWLWNAGRSAVEAGGADGSGGISAPLWIAFVVAGGAFIGAWCAFVAWRGRAHSRWRLERLGADATRIALGEYAWQAGDHGRPALVPIASALNRLASLLRSAESIIVDRDRQLTTMRGLGAVSYWETDSHARYTRLEYEASWPQRQRSKQVGQMQFDGARALDAARWDSACQAIAQRRPFRDLPLARRDADNREVHLLESGDPWFAHDGSFIGYSGVARPLPVAMAAADDAIARLALETSSEPTLLIALDGVIAAIRHANPAAQQLFEHNASALEAQRLEALLDTDQAADLAALCEALARQEPMRRTLAVCNRFGERIEVLARLEPVPDRPGLAVLALDPREAEIVRLRKHAADSEMLRERLSRQTQQLDRLTRESEAFASRLSHDLRAPLHAVGGFARLLDEDQGARLDEAGREHLAHILTGCTRMENMIEAVLTLSRVERQRVISTPVDLGRIAREVLETLARQEPQRRVELRIGDALVSRGDPVLLRNLLENLLGNAWKYTAQTAQARISFDMSVDAMGRTVFSVSDNGVGFDMRHADRLFGLFQRLHPHDRFPGSGVGLATVKRIVEHHGGAIWAESAPGKGSRFCFTLDAGIESPPGLPLDQAA